MISGIIRRVFGQIQIRWGTVKKLLVPISLAMLALVQFASAASIDDGIVERIRKSGSVCIEGQDCASSVAATEGASADSGPRSTYEKTCATCHAIGVAGAPKFAEPDDWAARIAKGMDALYASAVNGMPPGMPAKGMCFTCSDDDLKTVVDYMVEAAR
jgi:cytochrome c5